MAITSALCTSFRKEQLDGLHQTTTAGASGAADVFKYALFTSAATLDRTTTAYSATNEASGTGYSAGGVAVTCTVGTLGIWSYLVITDPSWSTSTITARGGMLYNSSRSNKAIFVQDFGADKTSTSGTFLVDQGGGLTSSVSITFATTSTITRGAGDFIADGHAVGHTIILDDATNPGPYTISAITATQITVSGTPLTAGGPRTQTIRGVAIAW